MAAGFRGWTILVTKMEDGRWQVVAHPPHGSGLLSVGRKGGDLGAVLDAVKVYILTNPEPEMEPELEMELDVDLDAGSTPSP